MVYTRQFIFNINLHFWNEKCVSIIIIKRYEVQKGKHLNRNVKITVINKATIAFPQYLL